MLVNDQLASATISPDEKTLTGLTPQDVANFNDPHLEFRRLVAEFIGSFLLVMFACGTAMMGTKYPGTITQLASALGIGFLLVPLILALGKISGAHFNPMVTLAFALRTVFPWKRVPAYVIVQFVGGLCAALFLQATLGKIANDGASTAATELSGLAVGMWEAFFTFILITIILAAINGAMMVGSLAAFALGGYFIAVIAIFGSLTGPGMNPARVLGPAVLSGDYTNFVPYILGPIVGMVAAVGVAWVLRGHPDRSAVSQGSAQGDVKDVYDK